MSGQVQEDRPRKVDRFDMGGLTLAFFLLRWRPALACAALIMNETEKVIPFVYTRYLLVRAGSAAGPVDSWN